MVWDKYQPFTRNSFREHVQGIALETMRGLRTDPIGGIRYLPYWWLNGEVRVFWEPGISWQTVDLIVNAVDQRARETLNVSLVFEKHGEHPSAIEQIDGALVRGRLDPNRLFSLALSEPWRDHRRGGRQHADIYITTKSFVNDPGSWAAACFKHGAMVFCLHAERYQHRDFLRRVALHETNHLLGMYCHCDDYQNVAGMPYTRECNMHYSCHCANLCSKCQTQLRWWWRTVQDEARRATV